MQSVIEIGLIKLLIKSKLADLELETGFKVTTQVETLIQQIEGVYVVA